MEYCYDAMWGNAVIGKIAVLQQGLYCKILCKCILDIPGMYKLHLKCFDVDRNLGVLIPDGRHYALETTIASKHIDFDCATFYIAGMHQKEEEKFIRLDSNTPFAYIQRLEDMRFAIRDGIAGILVPY